MLWETAALGNGGLCSMTEEQIINEIKLKNCKEISEPLSPMIATEEDIEKAKKIDKALSKALQVYLK